MDVPRCRLARSERNLTRFYYQKSTGLGAEASIVGLGGVAIWRTSPLLSRTCELAVRLGPRLCENSSMAGSVSNVHAQDNAMTAQRDQIFAPVVVV
jgi:hypothetical protein